MWLWKSTHQKKKKRQKVFPSLYLMQVRAAGRFWLCCFCCLGFSCRLLGGSGCGDEATKKTKNIFFFRWHWAIGFWKVLVVKINAPKKATLRHGISILSLIQVYVVVKINSHKKTWNATWFSCLFSVSLRCRVPKGSGCENQLTKTKFKWDMVFFVFHSGGRLLEGFGSGFLPLIQL